METVNRILQEKITARIAPNKAVLIFGARRVGKTVMMRKIVDNYSGRTMMLNGEDYDTLALLENRSIANYRHLLDGIDLLAIDEAQNIPQIGSILKLIVDEIPGISVLASGSSSFDLLNKTGEPLVGRSTQFLLTPFSQREIAQTETALETRQNLEARLIYGSYPEVVMMENYERKTDYLRDIVGAYLLKDILAIDGLKNSSKMRDLLRLIAFQLGSEVSYEELGKQLGMVNHKLGYKLLLSDILPQFEDIKNRIGVTDEVFIEHLAEWNTDLDKYITKNNIKDVIPDASFYDLTTKISNVLTDHINKIAFEALSEISVDTLYAQRTAHTSYYWFVAIKHLLAKIKSLPDNLTEFGKKILMDIASGTQSLNPFPNCFKNIVERLDKRKIKSTVTDIRNDFCIGKKTINAIKFQFFETWLRSHGNLKSQAGDVIDKIVKPVISDGACRSLILQNKDFYMDLINTAGDDAYELKKSLRNLIQKDSDPQLVKFVNSIDSVPEVETA